MSEYTSEYVTSMEGMNRLRDSWHDGSAKNLSFLSCISCVSCSIDGMGESKEDVMVHSLIDVSVMDMLSFFSCEAFEHNDYY